jgi:hypothetical protein
MVVENPARHVKQIAHGLVAELVSDGEAFLSARNDVLIPEHGELLGDNRLIDVQRRLQLLHGVASTDEKFQDSDPKRVPECAKELGFERLQLIGRHALSRLRATDNIQILL